MSWRFTRVLTSPHLGGQYFRRMLPRILGVFLILSFLRLLGDNLAPFGPYSGGIFFQLMILFVLLYILFRSAIDLNLADQSQRVELEKRMDYEKLFHLSTDMICITTIDCHFKQVNEAFQTILGYPLEEFQGKSFLNYIHPDDLPKTRVEMNRITAGKASTNFENRYRCRDGTYKILSWNSYPVLEDGLIFAVARDLSEKKKADDELRKAYEFSEAILDNVPNMIFVKDAKDLRFLRFNKAGEELIGYSREDLLGKNDYDFFPKSEADFFTSKDREVLAGKKVVEIFKEPIKTKQKGDRFLRTKKIPLYDPDGKPQYLLGISEDITEMERISEEQERSRFLVKSAERINKLIQNSMDAVVGMNEQGIITSWNAQAEKVFGWEAHESIGQRLSDLIVPVPYREKHQKGLQKFLSTGEGSILNKRTELSALGRVRGEFPVELSVTPIQENKSWMFYAFVRDISDRKRMEEQQQLLLEQEHQARETAEQSIEMRDDFLSIAAHELKTPITPISMQLQMLERTLNKSENQELPETIQQKLLNMTQSSKKELDRLTRLIDELLDVSRISAGRLVLEREEFNLSELLQDVMKRHQSAASKVGSTIKIELPPRMIGHWDRMKMDSVIENLITNAIKYGGGAGIEVRAQINETSVIFEIQDHGIGISPKDQEKVFERFERAVSVKNYSGLGLGLYISRKVIEAHKGSITLESELGKGSIFKVELPLH